MTGKEIEISYERGVSNEEGFFVLPGSLWDLISEAITIENTLPEECIFVLSKEGLEIHVVNPHVTLYTHIRIEARAFLEYGVKEDCKIFVPDFIRSRKSFGEDDEIRISWTEPRDYGPHLYPEISSDRRCRTIGLSIVSHEKGTESYLEQICPYDPKNPQIFSPVPERVETLRESYDVIENQCTLQIEIEPLLSELREIMHHRYTQESLFMARHGHGSLHIYTTGNRPVFWVRRSEIATENAIYSSGTIDTDIVTTTINPDLLIRFLELWSEESLAEIVIGNDYPIRIQISDINGYSGNSITLYVAPKIGEMSLKRKK